MLERSPSVLVPFLAPVPFLRRCLSYTMTLAPGPCHRGGLGLGGPDQRLPKPGRYASSKKDAMCLMIGSSMFAGIVGAIAILMTLALWQMALGRHASLSFIIL